MSEKEIAERQANLVEDVAAALQDLSMSELVQNLVIQIIVMNDNLKELRRVIRNEKTVKSSSLAH